MKAFLQLPSAPRIVRTAVIALLAASILLGSSIYWINRTNNTNRERLRLRIAAAYRQAANSGKVVQPGPEPSSLVISAKCSYSIPDRVLVTTSSGDKFCYWARGNPYSNLSAERWEFEQVWKRDKKGNLTMSIPSPSIPPLTESR